MSSANDYSKLRGAVAAEGEHDYTAVMRYASDPRNWFKRARGEWPEPPVHEEFGYDPFRTQGMTTSIVVVDGADGLTPDMLRKRPSFKEVSAVRIVVDGLPGEWIEMV